MRSRDLTEGPIVKGIVAFAVPLLGASIIQQLYGTVDLLFVGNVLGTASTAALGVGALLLTLLAGLFSGVAVGANVKVANLVGARNGRGLASGVRTVVILGVIGGVLLALLGEVLAERFLVWMAVPEESGVEALMYLRFACAAALPIALYNVSSGALRGLGDSSTPLIAQLIGGVLNIAANWLALCVLGLGITGCAAATFVSNGVAAAIACAALGRLKHAGEQERQHIDSAFAQSVLVFGLPVAAQTVAITLSNVVLQHQVDLLGVEAMAAFSIYLKVELPIYFPILAIGQAATTFVAQNDGAGDFARSERGARVCQWMCLGVAVAMSAVMLGCGQWAFWLFDQDSMVIGIGLSIIMTTFPFYFLYAILEVQADTMRGYGHSLAPALVVIANICILRVALVLALGADGVSMSDVAVSYPITWATTAVMMVVCRMVLKRHMTRHA